MSVAPPSRRLAPKAGAAVVIGLVSVFLLFIISGAVSFFNTRTLRRNSSLVEHTHRVLSALDNLLSIAKDAETGQRGYVLTGDERYLEPYRTAVARVHDQIDTLKELTKDNPLQQERIPAIREVLDAKLDELAETIELRRKDGFDAALKVVVTDRGKEAMDTARAHVNAMQQVEKQLRAERLDEMDAAYWRAVVTGILTAVVGILLSLAVGYLLRQVAMSRLRQDWLQAGQIRLSQTMEGDQKVEQLGDGILRFLCGYLDAHAAAFFIQDSGVYRRVATYGVPEGSGTPERFTPGNGLLGQAVKSRETILVRDVPEGYLTVGSALGHGVPRHLLIVPAIEDSQVIAVMELGFIHPIDEATDEFFERVSESIGLAVRSVNYRQHLKELLEETQRQGEELQVQAEELRVSNEELEEQSRALRESQGRLENQQAELEQTNAHLEEQSQLLEIQRDESNRVNVMLDQQSRELAQASQYKSDFLANMSHELRTPLNSSLILAKLLADNATGNLTAEQVEYAETIRTAGNDLLALINDILDLSKIEAGHMEVRLEPVAMRQVLDDLDRTFQPIAKERGVEFRTQVQPGSPDTIETDRQRLDQILRNLLSNAFKFTERGKVELLISRPADGQISMAVSDTGIGIPWEQQEIVFEAFRQVDGTSNRRFGGTGLGLSISRRLAKLLGGEIRLASEQGKGSTFTLLLPERYDAANRQEASAPTATPATNGDQAPAPRPTHPSATRSAPSTPAKAPVVTRRIADDREQLIEARRVLLVVEDDEQFARILYEMAHELEFLCLISTTAEDGFATAVERLPNAVVLDVGLPDHSGLWVLDRLKHDRQTRHIPVHVISAGDHTEAALALGAVGSMLKPVKRDELLEALRGLESRFEQRIGRVLVVEDDPVQLDSVRKLLGSKDLETVGASSAAECLERLKSATFDCMVLDLSLPDSSGHALLETLSREEAYSFPPVIVYTGRDLSADEEHQLRKYSRSIIIKGVKSPERLLDEVTLFLHKVVSDLPADQQRLLEKARSRDAAIEGRKILVVEDDVRNVFALTSILEPRGATVEIARNGREALEIVEKTHADGKPVDLLLMDVMMPEMDGLTATRELRKRPTGKKVPIIMLTAKAMPDDQEQCIAAGANDYMAKPLDVEKLLSLIRVWLPR